ncbi:MAG: hypothetical protein GY719_10050 [bacterium]|nr:hypothetical protein [bacterium]
MGLRNDKAPKNIIDLIEAVKERLRASGELDGMAVEKLATYIDLEILEFGRPQTRQSAMNRIEGRAKKAKAEREKANPKPKPEPKVKPPTKREKTKKASDLRNEWGLVD